MAATKKAKTGMSAAPSAESRTTAGTRKVESRNTRAGAAGDGTNPSTPKTRAATPKKAAPIKLTDRQLDFLRRIHGAGATGYEPANKNEQKSIDSMSEKKLLKRGTKNKEKGTFRYLLTKSGEKRIQESAAPSA